MLIFLLACAEKTSPLDSAVSNQTENPPWLDYAFQEPGPFPIGHMRITHQYTPISTQPAREIEIDIWYPTSETSGDPAQYIYGTDPLAFSDASPAKAVHHNGYPVHLHSHGYRGFGATSANLMRYFASHGWVSIAPNHTNNLLGDHQSPLPVSHFIHRQLDLQESLTLLETLPEFDTIQIHNVLMSGHSFGASYSTWGIGGASYDNANYLCDTGDGLEDGAELCTDIEREWLLSGNLADPRIQAIIPMAGTIRTTFFGDTGHQSVNTPILFLSGTEDGHASAQQHAENMAELDFLWLSLEGGCHQSFALGQCSTLDVELGFQIVNAYTMAFARKTILQEDNATISSWLDGSIQAYSEATLTRP